MRTLFQDIGFGLRVLRANPGFTLLAALTLALGISTTTTVFCWIEQTMLRPYHGAADPDQLSALETVKPSAPNGGTAISWQDFRDYRDNLQSVAGVAIYRNCMVTVGEGEKALLAAGEMVSPNYFEVLGVRPLLGGGFAGGAGMDVPGANPVVVIGYALWRNQFSGDPAIVGKAIRVNRSMLTVAGVAPKEFHGSMPVLAANIWIPIPSGVPIRTVGQSDLDNRSERRFDGFVRRRPGVSKEQAQAELKTLAARLAAEYPRTNRGISGAVLNPWEQHNGVGDYLAKPLRLLMGISILVLLIACANVANLLLARSLARQREFGIRLALGAGGGRIVRQLLTETLVLTGAGALIAYPLVLWMLGAIIMLVPSVGLPLVSEGRLDERVLLFTLGVTVLTTIAAGLAPALHALKPDINETLKDGGRSGTASRSSGRTRSALVIVEVALSAIALITAGVFVRSFRNALALDPGFESKRVLFGRFFIESAAMTGGQITQFAQMLQRRLENSAGIEAAAFSNFVPLSSPAGPYSSVRPEGYIPAPEENLNVNEAETSPGYFATLRIPIVSGRDFTARDDRQAAPVLIVNEAFARRFFAGRDPVGRKVRVWGADRTVIGMARDSKYFSVMEPPRPFFYLPFLQVYSPTPELHVFTRTSSDPLQAIPTMRRAVNAVDPAAAGFHAVPLKEYTQVTLLGQILAANLTGALAAMSLALAGLGLYSVMLYSVGQRAAEIGIRMAMGARPADVIAMVVRDGMGLVAIGLLIGLAGAAPVTRLNSGMLVNVDPLDPLSAAGAILFLCAMALVAAWIPARAASRIDPVRALSR